jgi:hypothetical protein|tara:strand:+ start:2023 stop:2238 length:216 start_codon:yes stop_codon:yes gene_type:complete
LDQPVAGSPALPPVLDLARLVPGLMWPNYDLRWSVNRIEITTAGDRSNRGYCRHSHTIECLSTSVEVSVGV